MKKSIKVVTLSLLATGMLAGCSSESPNWKSEYVKFMKENFYGEVLPYAKDFKDFNLTPREADGSLVIRGDNVPVERLAEYASLFKEEKGWELKHAAVPNEDEGNGTERKFGRFLFEGEEPAGEEPAGEEPIVELPLAYTFEKEFDTEDGKRYLEVQFGNHNEEYEWTADGSFFLFAGDPYVYEWPEDDLEAFVLSEFSSTDAIPSFAADRYQYQDSDDEDDTYALVACYTSNKEAASSYTLALKAATGWHVYGEVEFTNGSAYIADSPDGKFGLQYSYSEEEGYLIIAVTEANYLYSFPSAQASKYVKDNYNSDDALPVLPADHYRWIEGYDEEEEESFAFAVAYPTSEALDAGYSAILEEAGWTVSSFSQEGTYFAFSKSVNYIVYYGWYVNEEEEAEFFTIGFAPVSSMVYFHDAWTTSYMDELFEVFVEPSYSPLIPEPVLSTSTDRNRSYVTAVSTLTDDSIVGADVIAYDMTTSEFSAWMTAFQKAGWMNVDIITSYYQQYGLYLGVASFPFPEYGLVAEVEIAYFPSQKAAQASFYFLEPLETTFPSELNEILEDNELPTVPTGVEAQYYFFNSSMIEVYCYGVSSEEPDAGYSALFAEDENWILRNKDEQGAHEDPYYEMYIADSADGTISCYYYVEDDTLVIGVADILPFARASWPAADITAIFEEQKTAEYPVPAFEAESAYFIASADVDYTYASIGYIFFDGVEVDVKGATEEEINKYVTETLPGAGWTVDAEKGTATKKFVDFDEDLFGQATIQFGEEDGVFYVYMNAELKAIQYESFPSADVAAYLASQGFTDTIPALSDAELATSYTFDPEYSQIIIVAADGKKAEALEQYVADLLAAGWVEFGKDSWGDMQYISPNSELLVCPWASSSSSNNSIYIDFSKAPSPDFPSEEINEFLAENGFTETLPALDSDLPKGYEVSSRGTIIVTLGSGEDAEAYLEAYQAALLTANWAEYGPDDYGDMQYISPKGELLVCPYVSGSTVYISISAAPITSFPTEKIADSLEALGYTDVLPEYNGELATSFNWIDGDSLQLQINCEAGDESDLVAAYKQVLLDAGWTENGADQYGDTLYLSPNSQYEVTVWSAEDIGDEGFICVDFHFSE